MRRKPLRRFASLTARQSTTPEYLPVPGAGGAVAPYRFDLSQAEGDLGLQLGRYAELRLGIYQGDSLAEARTSEEPGSPLGLPRRIEAKLGGIHAAAIVDQFDNMNFPHEGYFVVADYVNSLESLGADANYEHLIGFVGLAATRGRHTLLGLSNYVSALGTTSPEVYTLGGLFRPSGLPTGSIRGQYGANVTAIYLNRIADLPLGLGNGIYLSGSIEAGNLWSTSSEMSLHDLLYAGSVSLGADTMFGPVYLAAGLAEGGKHALYLFVGRSF